jgi:hypothetical protein
MNRSRSTAIRCGLWCSGDGNVACVFGGGISSGSREGSGNPWNSGTGYRRRWSTVLGLFGESDWSMSATDDHHADVGRCNSSIMPVAFSPSLVAMEVERFRIDFEIIRCSRTIQAQ